MSKGFVSLKEKIGYSFGDAAANFIFQTVIMFLMFYYTDVFGLSPAVVGTLFLVSRIWDAINDPMMGTIADRTNTKWGKFRPWVLWTAVPFGIMGILTFTTPDFGMTGKIVWAYVTYIGLMMIYTANNIPYSALMGVITPDSDERSAVSSYRFIFAMLAAFAIQGLTLPLVDILGQGNDQKGYQLTMAIFSILAVIFFVITFYTTKERVQPDPKQKANLKKDFGELLQNKPWVIFFFVIIFYYIFLSIRSGVLMYYFKYNVGNESLFSLFNVSGLVAVIVGIIFSKPLSTKFGKKRVFHTCLYLVLVFTALFYIVPPKNVTLVFISNIVLQLVYGPTVPMLWAMLADIADYGEWKTGRRNTGITFSAATFGLKFGLGIGGALAGYFLQMMGYVADQPQTQSALHGILLLTSIIPAAAYVAAIVFMYFYDIDKNVNIQMQKDLDERRKNYAV